MQAAGWSVSGRGWENNDWARVAGQRVMMARVYKRSESRLFLLAWAVSSILVRTLGRAHHQTDRLCRVSQLLAMDGRAGASASTS